MTQGQSWSVIVSVDGDTILTLSSSGLSGIENISDYADVVRTCGEHLLAFIGPVDAEPFIIDEPAAAGEVAREGER